LRSKSLKTLFTLADLAGVEPKRTTSGSG
jgi:hypothetical protein